MIKADILADYERKIGQAKANSAIRLQDRIAVIKQERNEALAKLTEEAQANEEDKEDEERAKGRKVETQLGDEEGGEASQEGNEPEAGA